MGKRASFVATGRAREYYRDRQRTKVKINDNYLNVLICSFCSKQIKFNTKYIPVRRKKREKYYHLSCHYRLEGVNKRRKYRMQNPVGRYGAKTGG